DFGLRDTTVGEAERRLGVRIASVNDRLASDRGAPIARDDRVVAFGPMEVLQHAWRRRRATRPQLRRRREWLADMVQAAARYEPFLIYAFGFALLLFVAGSAYFTFALHLTFIEAMYFTASTMFTVGYGDITPLKNGGNQFSLFVAMAIMVGGVTIAGIFIASIASAF